MTREEAIEILKTDGCYECYVEADNPFVCNNGGCEIREAYYMAIEALESKHGDWTEEGYCPFCNCDMPAFIEDWEWKRCRTPYCPSCGAKMEGEEDEI